jgi:hypothetical protein
MMMLLLLLVVLAVYYNQMMNILMQMTIYVYHIVVNLKFVFVLNVDFLKDYYFVLLLMVMKNFVVDGIMNVYLWSFIKREREID